MTKKIGILVGSLRKDSWNRKVAKTVVDLLPEGYEAEFLEICNLPFYNEDFENETDLPDIVKNFREKVGEKDAFIFVTPEYNRGVPAVMKNAIDIATRPYNDQKWTGKYAAVLSASIGSTGGLLANYALRETLSFADMRILTQPEMFFANVQDNFDETGEPTERTIEFVKSFIKKYLEFIG